MAEDLKSEFRVKGEDLIRKVKDLVHEGNLGLMRAVEKYEPEQAHQIRAVTGATISSQSVAEIVNQSVGMLKKPLGEAADER